MNYCLHLLIGLNAVEENHGRWLTAKGSLWALVVAKGDPAPDAPKRSSPYPAPANPNPTHRRRLGQARHADHISP